MLRRLKDILFPFWRWYLIYTQPIFNTLALLKLKQKSKLKNKKTIVFFATFVSTWKHDCLYKLLENSAEFEPIILVCPVINLGYDHMLTTMDASFSYLKSKGYNVIKAYNQASNKYFNPQRLNPDVIVYLSPYHGQIHKKYRITKNRKILSVYMPYGFALSSKNDLLFNQLVHNLAYKVFYETKIHKLLATEYAINKGINVEVSGSLIADELDLALKSFSPKTTGEKLIIWAPHHTIDPNGFSSFLTISEFMLNIAFKYKDKVKWIFKPHPLLKPNLYKHPLWGMHRTDEYYRRWEMSEFSIIKDGEYANLFVQSDAIILDSISFIAEYLYVNKPMLFTSLHPNLFEQFNCFGQKALNCISQMGAITDIELFINDVIIGNDNLQCRREKFYNDVLRSEISPSLYIYNFLESL